MSKLQTILWFIKNPSYLPQAWSLVLRKITKRGDRYGEIDSLKICNQKAISEFEAVSKLTGIALAELKDIREIYPEIFKSAEEKSEQVPVEMGGAGALNLLFHLTIPYRPRYTLETGVAYGWSSLAMLLAMKENKIGKLYSVDMPYINMKNESYVGVVVPKNLKGLWKLIRKADRSGIPTVIKRVEKLEMCHYDSDKSYFGRSWAYPLLWGALRKNCLLISDDIQDNIAFFEFCKKTNREPVIVESQGKFVGIIQK